MATFNFTDIDYIPSSNFSFDSYLYKILSGTSHNYTAIWADSTSNMNTGKLYIATAGIGAALSIVDLQSKVLVDSYKIDTMGNNMEFLDSENIVDINISIVGE